MATHLVEDKSLHCSSCAQEKKDVEATHWCQHCNEGLCQACSCYHTRPRPSAHHKVLLLADIKDEIILLNKLQINTQCITHPDHPVIVVCENHEALCCTVCMATNHKMCRNVSPIGESTKTYTTKDIFIGIQNVLELLGNVDAFIEKENQRFNRVQNYIIEFREMMDGVKKKIDNKLLEIQRNLTTKQKKIKDDYDDRMLAFQKLKDSLTDYMKLLQNIHKFTPAQGVLARYQLHNSTKTKANKSFEILSNGIPEIKIKIKDTINLKDFNMCDIAYEIKKACISEFCSKFNKKVNTLLKHQPDNPMKASKPLMSCDLAFVTSVQRSMIHGGAHIFDATCLPDNSILLSDCENNQMIKLDENLGFLCTLPVACRPTGVCNNGRYVHVVCGCYEIASYTLFGPWEKCCSFDLDDSALGLACTNDMLVTGHKTSVVVRDSTGRQICRIDIPEIAFNYPALSHNGKMLYHRDGDSLVCKGGNNYTEEVWRYSSEHLKDIQGITADTDGNILVVEYQTQNFYHISHDGQVGRVFVNKTSICSPGGLFCNKSTNVVGVTSWSINDENCIELFKFKE